MYTCNPWTRGSMFGRGDAGEVVNDVEKAWLGVGKVD